jgi:hypothetical protein
MLELHPGAGAEMIGCVIWMRERGCCCPRNNLSVWGFIGVLPPSESATYKIGSAVDARNETNQNQTRWRCEFWNRRGDALHVAFGMPSLFACDGKATGAINVTVNYAPDGSSTSQNCHCCCCYSSSLVDCPSNMPTTTDKPYTSHTSSAPPECLLYLPSWIACHCRNSNNNNMKQRDNGWCWWWWWW